MIENPRKITKAMVEEMKRLKRQGMRGVDIARRLGVSPSTVYAYLRGRRVAPNVENPPEIALTTEALLQQALANPEIVAMLQNPRGVPTTIDQIRRIIELARAGYSDRAISKEVGLHPAHIGKIRRALGIYKRAGRGLSHPEYLYPVAMHLQRLGFSPVIQVPAGFKTTQLRKRAPRRAPAQTPAPAPTPTPTPIPIPTPVYVPAPPRGFTIAPPIQPQSNPPEFLGILGGFQEEIVSSGTIALGVLGAFALSKMLKNIIPAKEGWQKTLLDFSPLLLGAGLFIARGMMRPRGMMDNVMKGAIIGSLVATALNLPFGIGSTIKNITGLAQKEEEITLPILPASVEQAKKDEEEVVVKLEQGAKEEEVIDLTQAKEEEVIDLTQTEEESVEEFSDIEDIEEIEEIEEI